MKPFIVLTAFLQAWTAHKALPPPGMVVSNFWAVNRRVRLLSPFSTGKEDEERGATY
jgi:hypothetical protein